MADFLQQFRRNATQFTIRPAIAASATLPIGLQRLIVSSLIALAGSIPMLRWRFERTCVWRWATMYLPKQSGIFSPRRVVSVQRTGNLPLRDRGNACSQEVQFDESVRVLDEAVAEGRGVVLASPIGRAMRLWPRSSAGDTRWSCLCGKLRHPERASRKLKWYNSLGEETVLRPIRASTIKDAAAYLKVLKSGKLLAITPDILADPEQGVETRIFGRPARLHGGAFALAISARAPLIRASSPMAIRTSSVLVMFDRALPPLDASDRDAAFAPAVHEWCRWFEEEAASESRRIGCSGSTNAGHSFLHATPRTPGTE